MSQINTSNTPLQQTPTNTNIDNIDLIKQTQVLAELLQGLDSLPPEAQKQIKSALKDLPQLEMPKTLAAGTSSIALDILIDALGDKVRQNETKTGLATIKANAAVREAKNQEKIEKLQEQLEKLENKSFWDKLADVFKVIGMVAAVIGAAALCATGFGAIGAPALILMGVCLFNQVADSVGQAVSGHGWGLTSAIGWVVGKISGSEEAEMWTKMGLDVALSVATIAVSCGAGSGQAASSVAKTVDTATKIANNVAKAANVVQNASTLAQGGATAVSASYTYEVAEMQADQKRLEAILEQIRMVNELVTEHIKRQMEEGQKNTEAVTDIVKENAATQTAILTGGAANMA